jgi:hypothetical protein
MRSPESGRGHGPLNPEDESTATRLEKALAKIVESGPELDPMVRLALQQFIRSYLGDGGDDEHDPFTDMTDEEIMVALEQFSKNEPRLQSETLEAVRTVIVKYLDRRH